MTKEVFLAAYASGNYWAVVDTRQAFWNAWFRPGCKARQRKLAAALRSW